MTRAIVMTLAALAVGLVSGCNSSIFSLTRPAFSVEISNIDVPATGTVGKPVTITALLYYRSGSYKGYGLAETQVDETTRRVSVRGLVRYPYDAATPDMSAEKIATTFTATHAGTYYVEALNFISVGSGTATREIQIAEAGQ